jgi:hypothetical protein
MLEIIEIITFLWVLTYTIWAVVKISYGFKDTIYFTIIFFFIAFAAPLALDVFVGFPVYQAQPGFQLANKDMLTSIIYCVYIILIPPLWILTGINSKGGTEHESQKDTIISGFHWWTPILYLVLIGPLIAILLAPNSTIYFDYAVSLRSGDSYNVQVNAYQNVMSLLSLLSIISASGLLLLRKKLSFIYFMTIVPWISLAIWVNGKRAIIAFVFILLFYIFWQRNILRGWMLPTITIVAIVIAGFSFVSYQKNLRGDVTVYTSQEKKYDNMRVDYGRDNKTKMTIYAELHPDEMKILEFRGQSMLFYLSIYVPRSKWPDKPWPYAVYFTSAMLMIPPEALGWVMTTSWLEETIANFGWVGMLIGPLVISLICRIGDKYGLRIPIIKPLTVLISSLFLVVQLPLFFPMLLLWISIIAWNKLRSIKPFSY